MYNSVIVTKKVTNLNFQQKFVKVRNGAPCITIYSYLGLFLGKHAILSLETGELATVSASQFVMVL